MEHPPIRLMPHHRSFATLGPQSQAQIATALLQPLGFAPVTQTEIEGISGLRHRIPLLGVDDAAKRIVVVQAGAEELSRFFFDTSQARPSPGQPPPKTPAELLLEWLQKSLFTTFDLKEALQSRGWVCNTLYLFNSFETPTSGMTEDEHVAWSKATQMPIDTRTRSLGGHVPIAGLDVEFIRARVISTGAAFVDLNQLAPAEIGALANASGDAGSVAASLLPRLRLDRFFHPPLDELLLGTLAKAGHLSLEEVERAPRIAECSGHPLSENTIARGVPTSDPLATLRRLEDFQHVKFSRTEAFLEESGKQVVQQWERTPQESLFIKVVRELRLPEIVEAVIRGFRGGGSPN